MLEVVALLIATSSTWVEDFITRNVPTSRLPSLANALQTLQQV
jgi:hypothetical protein